MKENRWCNFVSVCVCVCVGGWVGGCVCVATWANYSSVDVFFTYGEYGFSSMQSWYYPRERAWDLRTKLCCNASRK